jgi:hypothetical protein
LRHSLLAAAVLVPAALTAQGPAAPAAPAAGAILAGVPAPGPRTFTARRTSAAITPQDLMSRLYPFADDSMMGREAGTAGNVKGTEYIAAEARRLGLQPAGDNGTYFQTIPLKRRAVDTASTITFGERRLAFGRDFASAGGGALTRAGVQVVYGGVVGDTVRLTAAQAEGKLVVMRVTGFSPAVIRALQSNAPLAPGAAAVALAGLDPFIPRAVAPTTFFEKTPEIAAAASGGPPLLLVTAAAVQAMFPQPLDGLALNTAGTPAALDVRVQVAPVEAPARNVVAVLPGSDARLRGQYVAVGAHNDHVGYARRAVDHDSIRIFNHLVRPGGAEDSQKQATPEQQARVNAELAAWRQAHPGTARADSINNGADDDGSGSVTVLEMAERLAAMKTKPKRSVLFVWHTGEEKGLWGSEWYTDHPTVPRDSIVAQLNMDMVGRGAATDVAGATKEGAPVRGGRDYLQLVGSRRLSTELGNMAETVNGAGRHRFKFDYSMDANGHPMNIYCRSDHYEYARYGIPIIFFTTGGHSDYHQVTDEAQYIDYRQMARVGNYVADLAVAVANLDRRVAVDKPKPDPTASCQQ